MKPIFEHLLGNQPIKAYLKKAIQNESLHHTLLFSGLEGIGKSLFAKELARELLASCETRVQKELHPDLHILRPEGKSGLHPVEQIREMIGEIHKPPFEAPKKVFIVSDAERMQTVSANAILKTLEEPDLDSAIILLSSSPNEMLPTILSRCVHLSFQPIPKDAIAGFLQEKHQVPPERAHLLSRQSHGSLGAALRLLNNDREESARQLLFDALDGKIFPFSAIEGIEGLFDGLDGIDLHHQVEWLLAAYLMRSRDAELARENGSRELLYFPIEATSVLSLEKALSKVFQARLALERNMRLSVCLDQLLMR
jgi:DNA polymerase-3 subunit delta'